MSRPFAVRFDEVVEGKNLSDLSHVSGVNRRTLVRLRDGKTSPQPLTRRALADVFGVEPETIVYPKDLKS